MTVDIAVQTRLNVLISSSRQWNPGDEFILLGVRRLLESLLGPSINYLLWNRNPDLFVDRWDDPRYRTGMLTNSVNEPSLDLIDLVVLAGTPEWSGRPLERIFRELLRFPDVPLVALGVGSVGPGFVFTPLEREIFARENTLIVCRNPTLADEINEQIGPGKALLMPCPALFCSPETTSRSIDSFGRTRPAINVQSDCTPNQSAPTEFVEKLIRHMAEIREISKSCFVAHYIDEFFRFSRLDREADIFYSYESLDYLTFFRKNIQALVTSRLHGAIAALSSGSPACLVDFGSDRVKDASRPFGPHLPCLEFGDAVEWLRLQTPEKCLETSNLVIAFKQTMFDRYLGIMGPFIARFVSPSRVARGVSR